MEGYGAANKEKHQEAFQKHLRDKKAASEIREKAVRGSYSNDKISVAIFDLQQVLNCPKSEVSTFFFKNKLSLYNFTVYDTGRHEGHCYLWNESIGKKGSNEIASMLWNYIEFSVTERDVKQIDFFRNSCGRAEQK